MAYKTFTAFNWALALVLIGSALAGRLDEVSRRKGFHPQALRDHELRLRGLDERATHQRRYYNNKTKGWCARQGGECCADGYCPDYFVESLPDIPSNFLTEMYSGLIRINESDPDRALFFVFQPRVGAPVDEVTIWLNGGPGCSSLEGFFQENGMIQWTWGEYAPTINDYSWPNLTNVLWVEQPVGTGFSIGKPTATSEEDIAADFVKFFKNFEVRLRSPTVLGRPLIALL